TREPFPPPQTIISLPLHTAVPSPTGAPIVLVLRHVFVLGLYLPPVFVLLPSKPPQTIISLPVPTRVGNCGPGGAWVVLVTVHLFVPGLYLPPVFKLVPLPPPQMI